jgi:uridine kinase
MLAGPSSSGKTTFAKRLTIQLLANGIGPELISLDDYYLSRERMPRNEEGEVDLEDLYALDVELINRHLRQLLRGEKITLPRYDFKTGMSERNAQEMELRKNQILIVEGIHGLNENLTASIGREEKCKIYISALTQLNLDFINRIPTSTVRLLRRIVRDHQFRSYTAKQTLAQWPQVRAGEGKHIFPFQEEADIMFNSSLVYEMSVLKLYVEPLLKNIEEEDEMYTQAKRLLHFTANFLGITSDHVPFTSILREFIGGSGFEY